MEFGKKIVMNGTVHTLTIPRSLVDYLEIKEDSIMVIQPEEGKHGKYFSVWIKKDK